MIDDFARELYNQIVVTGNRFLMERREDELALLFMLRTVHPRKTEANTTLRGAFRPVNELTGGAKFRGIAQNLSIEFRPNCENVQFRWFAKRNRAKRHQLSALLMQRAHAPYRVAKEVDVFAGRERARQDVFLHQQRC